MAAGWEAVTVVTVVVDLVEVDLVEVAMAAVGWAVVGWVVADCTSTGSPACRCKVRC